MTTRRLATSRAAEQVRPAHADCLGAHAGIPCLSRIESDATHRATNTMHASVRLCEGACAPQGTLRDAAALQAACVAHTVHWVQAAQPAGASARAALRKHRWLTMQTRNRDGKRHMPCGTAVQGPWAAEDSRLQMYLLSRVATILH